MDNHLITIIFLIICFTNSLQSFQNSNLYSNSKVNAVLSSSHKQNGNGESKPTKSICLDRICYTQPHRNGKQKFQMEIKEYDKGNQNSYDLKAFLDFLGNNGDLKQAILVFDNNSSSYCSSSPSTENAEGSGIFCTNKNYKKDLLNLYDKYRIRIFNLQSTMKRKNQRQVFARQKDGNEVYGTQEEENFLDFFYYGSHRIGIFVPQMDTIDVQQKVYHIASQHGLFNNSISWFIVTRQMENFREMTLKVFGKYNLHVNADITIAMEFNHSTCYLLYDVYKRCRFCTDAIVIKQKGFWNLEQGIHLLPEFKKSFVERRGDLKGTIVNIGTTILKKPAEVKFLEYLKNERDYLHLESMQRKSFRLFRDLEAVYNMTFNVTYTTAFGGMLPTRNWTGILGELATERLDFAIVPLRLTLERLLSFKYTPSYHIEDINILLRHPRRNSMKNIFIAPLNPNVWWCTMGIIGVTSLLLVLHIHYENKIKQKQKRPTRARNAILQPKARATEMKSNILISSALSSFPNGLEGESSGASKTQAWAKSYDKLELNEDNNELESRLDFVLLITLETMFNQGPEANAFNLMSTRILIFSTGLFSIILLQFYSAFIVGSLLAEEPRSITTPEALYQSNLAIGMENVSYNFDIFNKTSSAIAQRIFQERICKNQRQSLLSFEEGAKTIKKGYFAFQSNVQPLYRSLLNILNAVEFCDLQEIFISKPFITGSPIVKNCSYSEYLAQFIIKYRTTGLLDYMDKKWRVPKPDCSLIKSNEVVVDMSHFAPALMMLIVGMLLAFNVFILEIIIHHFK